MENIIILINLYYAFARNLFLANCMSVFLDFWDNVYTATSKHTLNQRPCQTYLTVNRELFSQNVPSQMLNNVVNTPPKGILH